MTYQKDGLALGSSVLYHISRTRTGAVVHCVVSIGLEMGQYWTVVYQQDC